MIATAALQEDVDVVGLSILSGAHMTLVPRVTKLLGERGMGDVLVTVGGIIPDDDVPALRGGRRGRDLRARARRSRRSPTTCGRTRDRATSVGADAAARAAAPGPMPRVAGDRLALARLLTAVENRTAGRRGRAAPALPDGRAGAPRRDHRAARARASRRSSRR